MGETTLAGKTAVILGASSPCGKATARLLASRGVNVALGGRSRDKLEALQAEIAVSGGQALVVGTHLAKSHHPAHLVEAALEEYGGLDILLFMARASAPLLNSLDLEAWERSVDVNVKGFMYCLAASLPALGEDGGGCVAALSVEDSVEKPDPLLRAGQAAVRTILEEISGGTSGHTVCAVEVRANAQLLDDPGRCAETMLQALESMPASNTGLLTYRI